MLKGFGLLHRGHQVGSKFRSLVLGTLEGRTAFWGESKLLSVEDKLLGCRVWHMAPCQIFSRGPERLPLTCVVFRNHRFVVAVMRRWISLTSGCVVFRICGGHKIVRLVQLAGLRLSVLHVRWYILFLI